VYASEGVWEARNGLSKRLHLCYQFENITVVNVVTKAGLRRLIREHPQAEDELLVWYKAARHAAWTNLADVRTAFPKADLVGKVLVFNVLHNDLRLIVVAAFPYQRLFVKELLTHKEYDRKEWMKWARQH
jgi:mRNA interferase HigB